MVPILLTPGPLTTADDTRHAMTHDWGSRDRAFVELSASVCRDLAAITGAGDDFACVPLQGSGTFAVEAAIGTLVPRTGCLLIAHNGSYGRRIVEICRRIGRAYVELARSELEPITPGDLDATLANDPSITHVALVHVETGAGLENPLAELAAICRARRVPLIVDAMSSFAALPLDLPSLGCDAIIAASGKCLEGPPGIGFVIARRSALAAATGNAASLALDLADQHDALERTGQWRFTPPTQIVAATRIALDRLASEGGPPARLARYRNNLAALVDGMASHGHQPLLRSDLQAPIIVSFRTPPGIAFAKLYERIRGQGYIVYPGKLSDLETFRIGCIGAIDAATITHAVTIIAAALAEAREPCEA